MYSIIFLKDKVSKLWKNYRRINSSEYRGWQRISICDSCKVKMVHSSVPMRSRYSCRSSGERRLIRRGYFFESHAIMVRTSSQLNSD